MNSLDNLILISFATPEYAGNQDVLVESARKSGINKSISYSMSDIKNTDFYRNNSALFREKRGAGFWAWKPLIILETIKNIKDDIEAFNYEF